MKQTIGRMTLTKIEAFLTEFPWLLKHVGKNQISSVFVRRVNPEVLGYTRIHQVDQIYDYYDEIIILDQEGEFLGQVGLERIPADPNRRCWELWKMRAYDRPYFAETVLGVLERIKEKKPAHFVVSIDQDLVCGGVKIIIYKSPRGFDIPRWVTYQREVDKEAVKKESDAVDISTDKELH